MQAKVSIIVPVYNAEWNLSKCITSLIRQTYDNIEIILVNDGSTDGSLEICKSYALSDSRILVINKPNTGVSDTRNYGIKKASGDYITFIDSDDWVDETYIEDFDVNSINESNIMITQGIMYDFDDRKCNHIMFKYSSAVLNVESDIDQINRLNILSNGCPVAKIFSTKTIIDNNIFFNTKISLNEDHLFVIDYLYYTNKLYLKNKINYHYYFNYKLPSLTKKYHPSIEFLESALAINYSFKRFINKFCTTSIYWKNVYTIFGPQQLIKASEMAFRERNSRIVLKQVVDYWRKLNIDKTIVKPYCHYAKVFIKNVDNNFNKLHSLLFLSFIEHQVISTAKYLIKKYILRY